MTPRAPKLCANPTCGELVYGGQRYCPACDQPRWKPSSQSTRKLKSNDAKWNRLRRFVLKRDGHKCQIRYVGICIGLASEADHITPVTQGGSDSPSNLQAACRPCHLAKSSDEGHKAAGHKPQGRIQFIPNELRGLP